MCELPCDNTNADVSKVHKLSDEETKILSFRFGFPILYLCNEHYVDQFSRYPGWHGKKCSDPDKRHRKPARSNLKLISLETARKVKTSTEFLLIPGQSLCAKFEQFLAEAGEPEKDFGEDEVEEKDSPQ